MTTADYFGMDRPHREPTVGSVLVGFVRSAFAHYRRWCALRRAVGELRELDDRMLSDIGLSRSTIFAAATGMYELESNHHVR